MSLCIFQVVFRVVFDLIKDMLNGKTLTKFTGNYRATELQNDNNRFFTELTELFLGFRFLRWQTKAWKVNL